VPNTVAEELLLDRLTTTPEEPAGPVRVAVPVEELPPSTDEGFKATESSEAAEIVKVAVGELPFKLAVIVEVV
jgi:hypothetical protein